MTFGELKETRIFKMAHSVRLVNTAGEDYDLYRIPCKDLLDGGVVGQHLSNGHLSVTISLEYSLVFKVEKGKNLYIAGFVDNHGTPSYTEDETKAYRFYNLNQAMRYYDLGYGIVTKVPKSV